MPVQDKNQDFFKSSGGAHSFCPTPYQADVCLGFKSRPADADADARALPSHHAVTRHMQRLVERVERHQQQKMATVAAHP